MAQLILFVSLLLVVAVASAAAAHRAAVRSARPSGWLADRMADRVLVHTVDDQSIEGTVRSVASDGVVLAAARILTEDEAGVAMAGDVWIPQAKVAMVQQVPGR